MGQQLFARALVERAGLSSVAGGRAGAAAGSPVGGLPGPGAPVESRAVYATALPPVITLAHALQEGPRKQPVTLVQPGSFLTLHYRLAGPDGADVVNTFGDKPATLTLGTGQLAPAIEAHLVGLAEGTRQAFDLPPGVAFGPRNPELLQRVKLSLLHEMGDPDAQYGWVTWSTSRPPMARPATPAWCANAGPTGCCSTSTTRWRACRCALKCT
jgi:hypothetical protein